jgi:Tat protein secretion system quality control protein TatD with DNase activity
VNLLEDVSKDDMKIISHCFQNDKNLGLNNLTIEFFLGFYEMLEDGLLKAINKSNPFGRFYLPLIILPLP